MEKYFIKYVGTLVHILLARVHGEVLYFKKNKQDIVNIKVTQHTA